MNNVHRAEYVECLVAELLGPEWTLPWRENYDWAPWDLRHASDWKLEVKQSAARQPWHTGENFSASPPRFDIAPCTGYWRRDGVWIDEPGRPADIYVFAWHGETREDRVDHRDPEQWMFFILPSRCLPEMQKGIGLTVLERKVKGVRYGGVLHSVARLMKGNPTTGSCSTSARE